MFCFFFSSRRRHTRYWRDWSSDVCSSDLFDAVAQQKYHWIEKIDHVHHAGNSSGIVDGASLLLIGGEQAGTDLGLTPRARVDRKKRRVGKECRSRWSPYH